MTDILLAFLIVFTNGTTELTCAPTLDDAQDEAYYHWVDEDEGLFVDYVEATGEEC